MTSIPVDTCFFNHDPPTLVVSDSPALIPDKISLFGPENPVTKTFLAYLGCLQTKPADANTQLMDTHRQNDKLQTGRMYMKAPLDDAQFAGWKPAFPVMNHANTLGGCPWMVSLIPGAWAPGNPTNIVLGIASLVHAFQADIALFIFPVSMVLDQGVSLSDVWSFIGTATGLQLLAKHAVVIYVPQGATAFVPTGFLSVPLFWGNNTEHEVASVVVTHVFEPDFLVISENVMRAIVAVNLAHYDAQPANGKWTAKSTLFRKVLKNFVEAEAPRQVEGNVD